MDFIVSHWYEIALIIVFICGGIMSVLKFKSKSKKECYEQIRGWLLQAVLLAEREFGAGTGKLKLSTVYDRFVEKFPWLAKAISFERFSRYVDDALDEMKEILQKNAAIASVVESKVDN